LKERFFYSYESPGTRMPEFSTIVPIQPATTAPTTCVNREAQQMMTSTKQLTNHVVLFFKTYASKTLQVY
jgi:hypothetical protein